MPRYGLGSQILPWAGGLFGWLLCSATLVSTQRPWLASGAGGDVGDLALDSIVWPWEAWSHASAAAQVCI
jgi:hypothetical protein